MKLWFLSYELRRLNEDHPIYTLHNSRNRGIATEILTKGRPHWRISNLLR
jgi:hypothetical protein